MVNAHAKLIAITVQILGGGIEVRSRVRHWVKAEQVLGNGIDRGQDVAWILLPGGFVDEGQYFAGAGVDTLRKVAFTLQRGRHGRCKCLSLDVAEAFVVAKKEGLIALDGSPKCCPKLILFERFHILRKEITGVKGVISQEIVGRPVQLVRTRARNNIRG